MHAPKPRRWERFAGVALGALALLVGCLPVAPPTYIPIQLEDRAPSWSPDGQRIAFVRFNPDVADTLQPTGVYTTDLSGNAELVVPSSSARSVDWSPDSRSVVFNDANGLHVVLATGDSLRTIYTGGSFPSWSPDGTEIAFSTLSAVWGISPEGTALRRITPEDAVAIDPDWSPDGRSMVVLGNPGSVGEEVLLYSIAEQEFSRLTTDAHEERSPAWSPRGDRIAWNPWPVDSERRLKPEVWVMDTLGTQGRRILAAETALSWNPAGTRLVVSLQTHTSIRLFLVDVDGTGRQQLTR